MSNLWRKVYGYMCSDLGDRFILGIMGMLVVIVVIIGENYKV